jgi:hypothetical protein
MLSVTSTTIAKGSVKQIREADSGGLGGVLTAVRGSSLIVSNALLSLKRPDSDSCTGIIPVG